MTDVFGMAALTAVMAAQTVAQTGPAPQSDRIVADLSRCLVIADDRERLACSDAAVRTLVDAVKRRDVVILDRRQITRTQRSLFGLPVDAGALLATPAAPAERIEALDTVVTAVAPVAGARWTLTLAEGGRWQTIAAWDGDRDPRPGMAVSLHRAALGSYILRSPGLRSIKVRRIP